MKRLRLFGEYFLIAIKDALPFHVKLYFGLVLVIGLASGIAETKEVRTYVKQSISALQAYCSTKD